jgi:hypothetical protein
MSDNEEHNNTAANRLTTIRSVQDANAIAQSLGIIKQPPFPILLFQVQGLT